MMIIIIINNNELFLQNLKECYSEIIEEIINDLTNDSCEIEYILNKDLDKLNKTGEQVYDECRLLLDRYGRAENYKPNKLFKKLAGK